MRIVLLAVGRLKAGPERELLTRYITRSEPLVRKLGIAAVTLQSIEEGRGRTAAERKALEERGLRAALRPNGFSIVLDEQGQSVSSARFAELLGRARDASLAEFAVLVGGPDGLDTRLRRDAALVMSFGQATLPYQLVQVLAAEQIYRALTILLGHPYHRQ